MCIYTVKKPKKYIKKSSRRVRNTTESPNTKKKSKFYLVF